MAADAHAHPPPLQHLDGGLPLTALAVEEREIGTRPEAQHAAEMGHRLAAEIDAGPFDEPFRHEYAGYAHVRVCE